MITQAANKLWLLSQKLNYKRFLQNKDRVAQVQSQKLSNYLSKNADTVYGKKHAFKFIKNHTDYAKALPVIEEYQQLSPYIQCIMQGEKDVLFNGKALFMESTSGSSGLAKYIPYNHPLKQEFDFAISAWMWNLYSMDPMIFKGKAYWSLSPALKKENLTESKTPIGTGSDMDYFNPLAAFLLKQIMAVNQLSAYQNAEEFYLQTWKQLLQNKNITFISVWSPQFLLRLIDFLRTNQETILKAVNCSKKDKIALQNCLNKTHLGLADLFPQLRLISCWKHAQSAIWQSEIKLLAGDIPVQGKGLLSTEGVVSIPWGMDKHLLAYQAHFYEFKGEDNQIYLAHQLQTGAEYECIITTGAGLYRYNTHDLVRCTGFMKTVPLLEFVGRSGNVSDLVGEKVSESALFSVFQHVKKEFDGLKSIFLFPNKKSNTAEYWFLITGLSESSAKKACDLMHRGLLQNPYYRQAIDAGQLQPLQHQVANELAIELMSRQYQKKKNIKDGDLKLPLLFPLGFWDELKNASIL